MVVNAPRPGPGLETMMRSVVLVAALAGLSACAPEQPGTGAGFSDYDAYREAQLTGAAPLNGAMAPVGQVPPTGFDPARVGAAIDAAEQGVGAPLSAVSPSAQGAPLPQQGASYGAVIGSSELFDPNRPRGDAPAGIAVESGEMARVNGGISDEQDFEAVAGRETIESDAQRIARNRAQYVVIEPTALPERTGSDSGPNIVEYAITTTNAVGQPLYSRSSIRLTSPEAACRRYKSPDLAQEAFLKAGGPNRDPRGLDPDGDGFACAWDPGPFRTALQ
jgi:hypothetical protein